ncbi:MAG: hypothetical protein WC389_09920 [Lutibacter sp.]|jgi:hypothetical protein
MGKQISIILVLLMVTTIQAQKKPLSYKQVDSTSYALYLNEDWKSLLEIGKKSRAEGIDFYYLKVRMGIAYYKEGKMLSAVKLLEEAYAINTYDNVVQEYLYWAYRYSDLILESHLFYTKMFKQLTDKIQLDLPFVTALDLNVLATNNADYDKLLLANDNVNNNENRYFPENYQLYSLGLNHSFSKGINFYHRISIMPTSSVWQENLLGEITNTSYKVNETRYYADMTVALGNRWYFDAYFNIIYGKYDNLNVTDELGAKGPRNTNASSSKSTVTYTDYVFGGSLTKASYYVRNTINVSTSNLNGYNQFQAGYTMSLYPLGSTLLVPFGAIQFQNEDGNSNMVYTGGLSVNTAKFSVTGYGNVGELNNFVSNNGSIIYNQSATALNEYGLILQFYTKNAILKVGYSLMEMEDYYYNLNQIILSEKFKFNQQNIIGGITWKF